MRIAWAVRLLLSSSVTASNVWNLKACSAHCWADRRATASSACANSTSPGLFSLGRTTFPGEFDFPVSSPIKLFEYLAAGLPILATRIDCHTNVVGNADCAVWLDQPNRRWVRDDPDAIVDGDPRTFHGWALWRP